MSDKQGKVETYKRKVEIIEEYLNIDDSLVELEQNKELIRMEMNIVEFPIFSRSKNLKVDQIKKYYFSSDKTSFLEVVPAVNTTIPGELEERVFIALLKIFRNNGYEQTFYCKMSDIFENMKVMNVNTRNSLYAKIRQAISKLATTTFKFKNLFYSNEMKKVLDDLIVTNVLTYRVITFNDSNTNEINFFSDKRVKEVYKITLSQHFYENIIKKGYLTFDADELLSIKDSVTRSIYTMITKWRNTKLYLIKPAFYIARRVPLAWEGSSIRKTILKIEKSLNELKNENYITDFKLNRKGKWEKSEFEIFFADEHNKIKRELFYDEKANYDKLIHMVEDRQIESETNNLNIFIEPEFNEILASFPQVARNLKTLPNVIREALKKYEQSYVKYTAEYTAIFCKISYLKYFKDALEKNWADEYIAKKELKVKKQEEKLLNPIIEEAQIIEENPIQVTWEEYETLDINLQEEIKAAAFEEFLMQTESKDNKTMRGIFEKSKKSHILKIFNEYEIPKIETMIDIKKIVEIKSEEKNSNVILSGTFLTVSSFMLKVITFIKVEKLDIDTESFVTLFNLIKEFEDEKIKVSYSEVTKIGEIIKK